MTCQGQPQLLHLSSPNCLPELWPWIWPAESVALPLSSGRHTPATAPAHPDARAQPCVDCAAPLGELSALFPSHLRQEPRCFSFEGASWRGAEFPHPFLQPQRCLQCSLEWEGDRVQAEHNARPPFLALDFPARLRSAVPDVGYQLHWSALQHAVLQIGRETDESASAVVVYGMVSTRRRLLSRLCEPLPVKGEAECTEERAMVSHTEVCMQVRALIRVGWSEVTSS